jgi:hypothetical protein
LTTPLMALPSIGTDCACNRAGAAAKNAATAIAATPQYSARFMLASR